MNNDAKGGNSCERNNTFCHNIAITYRDIRISSCFLLGVCLRVGKWLCFLLGYAWELGSGCVLVRLCVRRNFMVGDCYWVGLSWGNVLWFGGRAFSDREGAAFAGRVFLVEHFVGSTSWPGRGYMVYLLSGPRLIIIAESRQRETRRIPQFVTEESVPLNPQHVCNTTTPDKQRQQQQPEII